MEDRNKMKKIRIWVSITIVVLLTTLWSSVTNAPVEYRAPPRLAMPNPNAYDTYIRAAQSLVNKDQITEALSTVPSSVRTPGHLYNTDKKRSVVKANKKALSIFREGLDQDFLLPSQTDNHTPKLSEIRNISRLIALESVVYRESGENGKAMVSCLDGMKMANDIAVGGNLFPALVSNVMQVVVRNEAWGIVDSLSLPETQEAITRLNNILVEAFPFKSLMIEEKNTLLSTAQELCNSKNWRSQYIEFPPANPWFTDKPVTWGYYAKYTMKYAGTLGMSRRGLFSSIEADMEKQLNAADLSYPEYCRMDIHESNKITREVFPMYRKLRFKYEYNRCMNDFLLVLLSLHAYQLERGKYPVKLDELMPKYLANAPMDPFTSSAEYKYNRRSNGYMLYSVGPDLKDDGGKAVVCENPKFRYVTGRDKGDIVAGFNR